MRAIQAHDLISRRQLRQRWTSLYALLSRRDAELDTIQQLLRQRAVLPGHTQGI